MTAGAAPRRARVLSLVTVVGCVLYVALDVVAQLLPPHYSPIRQAESDLGVGPYGWVMNLNFLVRAALSLALVGALAATRAPRSPGFGLGCLAVWGASSGLLAFFHTDILDAPRLVPDPAVTVHGEIHLALATVGFIAAALGALVVSAALRRSGWPPSGPLLTLAVLSAIALVLLPLSGHVHHAGGLGERIFLLFTLVWMLVTALCLRGRAPAAAG